MVMKLWCTVCLFFLPLLLFAQPTDMFVIDEYTPVPEGYKHLGEVNVRDGLKLSCGFFLTMNAAVDKVKKLGGNVLKIKEMREPTMWGSACYRIIGDAYTTTNFDAIMQTLQFARDTITPKFIADNATYALLCIYRPRSAFEWTEKYKVYMDDQVICTMGNNEKQFIKITRQGRIRIGCHAKIEDNPQVDIRFGNIYFFRIETPTLDISRTPLLFLANYAKGYTESMQIKD
jgi:hypothetical protein